MSRHGSALIVIDVQESFRHMPDWEEAMAQPFQQSLLRLEQGARELAVPVVHVFHVGRLTPFKKESGLVKPLAWLPGDPALSIEKHVHNAFTDTGLDLWLRRQGIQHLVISGIRTEQCCETTARVAADIGYAVDFVPDATLTFPMTHAASGHAYSAAEIKARTELVLADRFARIASVDDVLAHWDQRRAA